MADGQIPPPADPQGAPPSGNVSATATCCPDVSTFEGSARPNRVKGFDARTNLVNSRGSEEYWIPPTKAKAVPGDRYTQDGAAWASVGLGETVDLEIAFEGHSGNGCLINCSFETAPGGIVEIETTRIASNNAAFRLKGLAKGETTIKVICNGSELGWVHVVCYEQITLRGVVTCLVTPNSREVAYSAAALQTVLNRTFKQALITFDIEDAGTISYGTDETGLANLEGQLHTNVGEQGWDPVYVDGYDPATGDVLLPGLFNQLVTADLLSPYVRAKLKPEYAQHMKFVYYVPSGDRKSLANGSVPAIGQDPCFSYKDFVGATREGYAMEDSYAILAHEAGHALMLRHPNDPDCAELPGHLTASCAQTVSDEPATNTEPAIVVAGKPVNEPRNRVAIMARDPLNLMGYWPDFMEQLFIRKGQWDQCRAGTSSYKTQ